MTFFQHVKEFVSMTWPVLIGFIVALIASYYGLIYIAHHG